MKIGLPLKPVKVLNSCVFLLCCCLFVVLKPYEKLSTHLLSLLPQNEETQLLRTYEKFQSSKEIFVALKGDGKEALTKIKALEKQILSSPLIQKKQTPFTNRDYRAYQKKYQWILQDFEGENLENIALHVKQLHTTLQSNPSYTQVDRFDPLNLFSYEQRPMPVSIKNGHLYLNNYGYFSLFVAAPDAPLEEVYAVFKDMNSDDVKVFSPLFYFVENAVAIKADVNRLIYLALGVLLVLYVVILKNVSLFVQTTMTLLSASIVALFVVTSLWQEVSLFVMVFGVAISTVAIDYMFHHYFCGYYEQKKGFNTAVFFGFFSTFLAFLIISFVAFPFIRQVSVFSLVSLSYSYGVFAFYFPKHTFASRPIVLRFPLLSMLKKVHYQYMVLSLFLILGVSTFQMQMDSNIKNLDYKNQKLEKLERFFKEKLGTQHTKVVIFHAKSLDGLIQKAQILKKAHKDARIPLTLLVSQQSYEERQKVLMSYDFPNIVAHVQESARQVGFREGFFKAAYTKKLLMPPTPNYTLKQVHALGFDVYYDGKTYFAYGLVADTDVVKEAYVIDSSSLFASSLTKVQHDLMYAGALILLCIVLIFYKTVRENFFKAVSFLLFPATLVLVPISFAPVNILQLFMLFVLMALCMDYGIYMGQKKVTHESRQAVTFSLLSTFAGFGVLVFSQIGTLFFIGEVATLGIVGIIILLLMDTNENNSFR